MASAAQPPIDEQQQHQQHRDWPLVERARFVREQVALLQRYAFMCTILSQYQNEQLSEQPPPEARRAADAPRGAPSRRLVPLRFPVQLTPKTRGYFLEGLATSLAAFINAVHHASVHTSVEFLEPGPDRLVAAAGGAAEFANAMAADFWVHTTRLVDREISPSQAQTRLLQLLDDFATRAVADERARLRELHGHCACLRDACNAFAQRRVVESTRRRNSSSSSRVVASAPRRNSSSNSSASASASELEVAQQQQQQQQQQQRGKAARLWLAHASRGGACLAVRVLARRRRQAAVFAQLDVGRMVAAFGSLDPLGDRAAEALYDCMERTHAELAKAMTW